MSETTTAPETTITFFRKDVVALFHAMKLPAVQLSSPNAMIQKKLVFIANNYADSIPEGLTESQNALLVEIIAAVKGGSVIDVGEPAAKAESNGKPKAKKGGKDKKEGKPSKNGKAETNGKHVKEKKDKDEPKGPRKLRTGLFSIAYGILEKSKKPLDASALIEKAVEKGLWSEKGRNLIWDRSNLIQALRKNAAKGKDALVKEAGEGTYAVKA